MIMVYGSSNGHQNDSGNYFGPCSTWVGMVYTVPGSLNCFQSGELSNRCLGLTVVTVGV